MIRSASRINESLHKKRRQSLWKKTKIVAILIFVLLILLISSLHINKIKVAHIVVSGNSAVSSDDISAVVNTDMQRSYAWIIPTNNFFLLRRSQINTDLLQQFPTLQSVDVSFDNLTTLHVSVIERTATALWCAGTPNNAGQCYYMDENSFVFAAAPQLSGSEFKMFFGGLSDNPIASSYASSTTYAAMNDFLVLLGKMQFQPGPFVIDDAHNYHVVLSGGGKILLTDTKTFSTEITELQAMLDNGYVKTTSDFLSKLDYINLQYENKAIFKMK